MDNQKAELPQVLLILCVCSLRQLDIFNTDKKALGERCQSLALPERLASWSLLKCAILGTERHLSIFLSKHLPETELTNVPYLLKDVYYSNKK